MQESGRLGMLLVAFLCLFYATQGSPLTDIHSKGVTDIELENVIRKVLKENHDGHQKRKEQTADTNGNEREIESIMEQILKQKRKNLQKRDHPKIEKNDDDKLNKINSETLCENDKCHKARVDDFNRNFMNDGHERQKPKRKGGNKRYIDTSGNGLWPNGIVPYDSSQLTNYFQSSTDADITQSGIPGFLLDAVELFKEKTCLEWRQRASGDGNEYVKITGSNTGGCSAGVGRYSGTSTPIHLNLHVSGGCNFLYVVLHEFMHVIDGTHEQQRRDRDEALTMIWSKLQPDAASNYITEKDDTFSSSATEFSLASVLMYSRFIFAVTSGQETMSIKDKDLKFLTEDTKNTFSFYDREAITNVYQCGKDCTSTVCHNGGFATKTVNNPVCTCVCPEHLNGASCEGLTGSGTCSRTITLGESGSDTIATTNQPYTTGRKCVYLIKASAGSRIRFDLNNMDIAKDSSTCIDTLEIRYNLIGEPGPEFCGSTTVTKTMLSGANSESHLATVIWDTTSGSSSTAGNGFSLTVTAIKSGCYNRPCKNGGTCAEDLNNPGGFICTCPSGIGGNVCSEATGTVTCNEGAENDIDGTCFLEDVGGSSMRFGETIRSGQSIDPPEPADGLTFYRVDPTGSYFNTDAATLQSAINFPDDATLCVRFKAIVNDPTGSASQLSLQISDDANTSPTNLLTVDNTGLTWVSKEHEISPSSSSLNRKIYFRGVYGAGQGVYLDDISVFQGKCDLCTPNPCQHGGSCAQSGNERQCTCSTGFQGATCGDLVQCLSDTCKNGGTCINTNGVLSCDCVSGFIGQTCENTDLCAPSNPCKNGGTCSQTDNTFTCTCASGFWGTICDVNDLCSSSNNCQNGATCIQTGVTTTFCNCASGFYGTTCGQTNVCSSQPCQNSGSCNSVGSNTFYCNCASGFLAELCYESGTGCSFESDQSCPFSNVGFDSFDWDVSTSGGGPFTPQHGSLFMSINNNGRQVGEQVWLYASLSLPNGDNCLTFYYIMSGAPGNFGAYSTTASGNTLSSIWYRQGESLTEYKEAKADIPSGHTKVAFIVTITVTDTNAYVALDNIRIYPGTCDLCKPNICQNGGTCTVSDNTATCTCPSGYTGTTCSEVTPVCLTNPCLNGGICSGNAVSFTCACASGFSGLICENSNSGPCSTSPCQNGGVCSVSGSTFICSCTGAFTGNTCETSNPCVTNPCQNSGTCTPAGSSYTCSCSTGFTGTNCEVNDPCKPNPCQNSGTCTASGSPYTCSCTSGFLGTNCDVVDPCVPNPCQNSGTCTASGSSYTCSCTSGFSGNNCDVNDAATIMVCSFEVGESNCGMVQINNDYFDWSVISGAASGTGPSSAYDGSRYMYIDTNTEVSGTYAMLGKFNLPAEKKCLTFNYHIKGQTYYLQVYAASPFGTIWETNGANNNAWQSRSITISSSYTAIYIVGWKGDDNQGHIALDNVQIRSGSCT
ncbi:neurogenic locus notch homolog protein 1-like [Pecten maximus]|uniref:neurogenic locus notch homolog protein 1-like n=1 Tax=Pecten maximus TaxID=6579 RepID=UPI0014580954|nr:neurogenic locus notch homolog protein 1-like [Pecten maximus]